MNYSHKSSISGASAGVWIPPAEDIGFVGTWTQTRNASGDYSLNLTAAANSPFLVIPLDRGILLRSFDLAYSIGTADLTSLTVAVKRRSLTSGAVSAVSDLLAAAAIAKVQTTNILIVNTVVGKAPITGAELVGPVIAAHENVAGDPDNLPNTDEWIEIAIVNPGTSVFKFYGCWLYGDRLI